MRYYLSGPESLDKTARVCILFFKTRLNKMCTLCYHTVYTCMYCTLVYATGGRELVIEAVLVDIVSSDVTPSVTRAGTA